MSDDVNPQTSGKRILVAGSRDWADRALLERALMEAWLDVRDDGPVTLVSGNCPTGADALAEQVWAFRLSPGLIERHPADWKTHGRAAGPLRNQHMVDLGADLCVAFVLTGTDPETGKPRSRGTWNAVRAAQRAGIPVRIIQKESADV